MTTMNARAIVGRKTPSDGKIEITAELAERFLHGGPTVEVRLAGRPCPGHVEAMPCGCGKGGPGHVHYFLQSDALRELRVDTPLALEADPERGIVRLELTTDH
jgi:hypothetical protein